MSAAEPPVNREPRGIAGALRVIGGLILLDVFTQFPLAIFPFDSGRPGWRLTAVQLGVTQLLPLGMALLLFAIAARAGRGGSLQSIRLACGVLALLSALCFLYLATTGAGIVENAQPDLYARMRAGLLRELGESAMAVLGFGLGAVLLWRLVPDRVEEEAA